MNSERFAKQTERRYFMLTKRENLLETIRGGNPDRYVNSYEPFEIIIDPIMQAIGGMPFTMQPGDVEIKDGV
jgi:hypothetical protein